MSVRQTIKAARSRGAYDPDRSENSVGQFYGNNFPSFRVVLPLSAYQTHVYAVRYGVVVAPGTHPNNRQANHIVRESGVKGFAARRLLTACLP